MSLGNPVPAVGEPHASFVEAFGPGDVEGVTIRDQGQAVTLQPDVRSLIARFGGRSFRRGIYRVHSVDEVAFWTSAVNAAFPEAVARLECVFARDWLGRQFGTEHQPRSSDGGSIVMLDPGAGEALEIPGGLVAFHDGELVEHADAALAEPFLTEWSAVAPGSAPTHRDICVGYRIPLFLGGSDTVDNLEVIDLEVYWSICAQLLSQVRDLPPGTQVRSVRIE